MMRFLLILGFLVCAMPAWAGFDSASGFRSNPPDGTGRFAFDLEMRVTIQSPESSGSFTVFVNSADGSMALDNPHTALWALGMKDIPDLQIHHVIFRQHQIMVCGLHPDLGEGCIELGLNAQWVDVGSWLSRDHAERFFASARATGQSGLPCCLAGTRGLAHLRGQGADGSMLNFWFDPGIATVNTAIPFLGPGVGIMKDRISQSNRVVRHFFAHTAEHGDLEMHLEHLSKVNKRFDLTRYPLVTAFAASGLNDAKDASAYMSGRGQEIMSLGRQMASCAPGLAGKECRAEFNARIKALDARIKSKAFDFATKHGLPGLGQD